jgi:hypothetical protein
VICVSRLDHIINSGFVSLEGRPNSWFFAKFQVARSREGDPDHWIQVHGRTVGLNFTGYHISEVRGLKELIFDCRSHEVLSVEGS